MSALRLLAWKNNERGDLFTRLTEDLFFALGYRDLRLDVHKSGRELDVQGFHRFEPKLVVAECKAHATKMGGAELNKFFGALTRERKKHRETHVAGYFISLSGFTETGIEQELETDTDRIILLDSSQVVSELERCGVITSLAKAAEQAGKCIQHAGVTATLDGSEILGHQRGYIRVIYYTQGKQRTHFSLIHADGTPLSDTVAKEIVAADRKCSGELYRLQYIAPTPAPTDKTELATRVANHYSSWLAQECGYIQLDGLPADTDLSATKLKLERLFVPLKATMIGGYQVQPYTEASKKDETISIGELLSKVQHIALLAVPGGGKSTLLKRLATAYAFPERRHEVADDLPARDWLPLILRCRELRDRAHRPIIELLDDIPKHAGMNPVESSIFCESIHSSLRTGRALLLIDGLDEISDEGARQTFANHLRTFIAIFPQAALVVTSREAGFRLVAGVVASACIQAKIAPLNQEDIVNLCERWHVEVVADTAKVRAEAIDLGNTIWENRSIRTLTENPLLLTTLLIVKRSVGELPRSRTALYREAIKVLVRTWNVEGYEPLDEEETLAQLSYVASVMMEEGKQQITYKRLLRLLGEARRELDVELHFTRVSPQEFIQRIEYRSSLLMQTGHERVNGELEAVFEFRHLTFQEYLAARGYFEEHYSGRDEGKSFADVLEPHFADETWQEVIPLAAVLAGRKADELIRRLVIFSDKMSKHQNQLTSNAEQRTALLSKCILDEVQVSLPTINLALDALARRANNTLVGYSSILKGKFKEIFWELVEQNVLANKPEAAEYLVAYASVVREAFGDNTEISEELITRLKNDLDNTDRRIRIQAALMCMHVSFGSQYSIELVNKNSKYSLLEKQKLFQVLVPGLSKMLKQGDWVSALAASWAFAWIGNHKLIIEPLPSETLLDFYRLWRSSENDTHARYPSWALTTQRLLPRDEFQADVWGECDSFLRNEINLQTAWTRRPIAALLVAWYRRKPWSDSELTDLLEKYVEPSRYMRYSIIDKLLETLGEPGQAALRRSKERLTNTSTASKG